MLLGEVAKIAVGPTRPSLVSSTPELGAKPTITRAHEITKMICRIVFIIAPVWYGPSVRADCGVDEFSSSKQSGTGFESRK